MSQKNDFKAFSISNNANVVSQEKYEENQSLQVGFPPENISTHILNKALRQSSTIAAVIANFIATQSDDDVLDDGDAEIPNASLTQKGIVQLTNEIGNNETLAVTQKLVQEIINSLRGNNGSAFNILQYPKLAEAYPDGRLPDLRGEFIRGWDDNRGVDPSRSLLSWQEGSYLLQSLDANTITFALNGLTKLQWDTPQDDNISARVQFINGNTGPVDKNYIGVSRPRNIAFNYIVKAA
ncbi:phage tail protein [Photorhabdus aegyptia]|uniref:Phage-related tail fiber protein n=1 Tax=Photorhabdus aegyptia TaxID=2805098 RepID=A0A022PLV7_9GAMM|nr:phage tail protein [Photorhabdus aegyptia]EYU16616.1 phage-related tail fiber protein [Photorhabdus aegyptia]